MTVLNSHQRQHRNSIQSNLNHDLDNLNKWLISIWQFQGMGRSRVQGLTNLGSISEIVCYVASSNHAKFRAFITLVIKARDKSDKSDKSSAIF